MQLESRPVLFFGLWMLTFLGMPIGGGIARLVVGPADTAIRALLAGLLAGAVIGFVQWLMLRQLWPVSPLWIAATAAGLGIGSALSVVVVGNGLSTGAVVLRGLITGVVIAAAAMAGAARSCAKCMAVGVCCGCWLAAGVVCYQDGWRGPRTILGGVRLIGCPCVFSVDWRLPVGHAHVTAGNRLFTLIMRRAGPKQSSDRGCRPGRR